MLGIRLSSNLDTVNCNNNNNNIVSGHIVRAYTVVGLREFRNSLDFTHELSV